MVGEKFGEEGLISIIIPVYNAEKYLSRCLDSVVNQTYKKLEIIVVDDGSTDNSRKILEKYKKRDNRIVLLYKDNGGQSSARNIGLKRAKGEYIGFVDSDDYIVDNMYEFLKNMIEQYHADIAMCDYTRKKIKLNKGWNEKKIVQYRDEDISMLFYRLRGEKSFYSVWNRLYRKKLLLGINFIEGKTTEDVLFTYDVYKKASKVVYSSLKKYMYYTNQTGITRNVLCEKDFSLLEIWDEIVKREQGMKFYDAAVLNRKRATYTLYVKALIYGMNNQISKDVLENWRQEIKHNYIELKKILDWKRKLLLWYICTRKN